MDNTRFSGLPLRNIQLSRLVIDTAGMRLDTERYSKTLHNDLATAGQRSAIGVVADIPERLDGADSFKLIFGHARAVAMRELGWAKCHAVFVPMGDIRTGKYSAQQLHRWFTLSELGRIGMALINQLRLEGSERMPAIESVGMLLGIGKSSVWRELEAIISHGDRQLMDAVDSGRVQRWRAAEMVRGFSLEDQARAARGELALPGRNEARTVRRKQGKPADATVELQTACQEITSRLATLRFALERTGGTLNGKTLDVGRLVDSVKLATKLVGQVATATKPITSNGAIK